MATTKEKTLTVTEAQPVDLDVSRVPLLEKKMRDLGVRFSYVPEWPVEAINIPRSRQNQARDAANGIIPELVSRYAEAYKRGDQLPAVVLKPDGRSHSLLDGNNRHQAAISIGLGSIPAYEAQGTDEQLEVLKKWCNATLNGEPPSQEERIRTAIHFIDGGMTINDAAAEVNLPYSVVSRAWVLESVNRRLSLQGVKRFEVIPSTLRAKLNTVKNDKVLKRLAEMVLTYKPVASDFEPIIVNAKDAGTEEIAFKQLDEVEPQLKADFAKRGGGKFRPPSKGNPQTRVLGLAHMQALQNLRGPEVVRACITDDQRREFAARVLTLADHLMVLAEEVGG